MQPLVINGGAVGDFVKSSCLACKQEEHPEIVIGAHFPVGQASGGALLGSISVSGGAGQVRSPPRRD